MPVRVTQAYEGVEGAVLFEAIGPDGAPIAGKNVALVGLTHGNEIVGEAVLRQLTDEAPTDLIAGTLLLLRNNLAAAGLNKRNTADGTDLNRLWDADHLAAIAKKRAEDRCWEERRALEVAPILVHRDAILDLHSSSRPAPAFLVFRDDQAHGDLARRLGIPFLVTGLHEGAILDGGMVPEVGLNAGDASNRIGFLFESGQHLDPANVLRARDVCYRFLFHLGIWRQAPPLPPEVRTRVYEVTDRVKQVPAARMGEPWRFVGYEGGEPGAGRRGPARPLASFDEIEAGEMVLKKGRAQVLRAHAPFTMLLPTPTADPNTDMYYVTQERPAPRVTVRTRDEARNEALGIERMLDLIDDDEFARGATRVSFDARHILDSCAEFVGRAIRLPDDHPHRHITIIGRGDWGGDEMERRAGMRYRSAMRAAVAEGVPVDRIQLMRGAQLGWLRVLTAGTVGGLVDRRRARTGGRGDGGGLRLWLSARQPHTVSLLVVGDLERALEEGDFRHVRIGMIVEAAAVEGDGAEAHVRISRLGLFSARPEMLRATRRLVDALKDEHRYLVRRAPLADHPAVSALLDDEFAIRLTGDAAQHGGLRDALCRFQLASWREAFRDQGETRIGADEDVGPWLAGVMSATGILDGTSLKAIMCERNAAGTWWAHPQRIAALLEDVHAPIDGRAITRLAPERNIPEQPLFANEVDADVIERWIGWKRFIRGVQTIPDTRGTDIELTFDEAQIGLRARDTLRYARVLAAERPGHVLVVIAGDGQRADRERKAPAGIVDEHGLVITDANLRYLRIQHAQGTFLAWWKDVRRVIATRPADSAPVAVQWEGAHGSSLNVLLVAVAPDDLAPDAPFSLEGWTIVRASVLLSELRATGTRDYRVGLYTELGEGGREPNAELVQFGRAHCEALLAQGGARLLGASGAPDPEAFDAIVVGQIAEWLQHVRSWGLYGANTAAHVPREPEVRAKWVAGQLGLGDPWLARSLSDEMDGTRPALAVARAIWDEVPSW